MTDVKRKKSSERHKVKSKLLIPNDLHELHRYYEKHRLLSSMAGNAEEKKLKRRVSDAKCRANISAGFDLLRKQVLKSPKSPEKFSKEMVLNQSYVRIKYLEGILLALHHTKELKQGKEEKLKEQSPLRQLKNFHHQFVAIQQRKGCVSRSSSTSEPSPKTTPKASHATPSPSHPITKHNMDTGIKRLSKRRRVKRKPTKSKPSSPIRKKSSPIVHLPPSVITPSRPQKRIKLASTDSTQDQVVPFSPILHPKMGATVPLRSASVTTPFSAVKSQAVPQSTRADEGMGGVAQDQVLHSEGRGRGRRKLEDKVPASPVANMCTTPNKREVPFISGSPIKTPMKMYQIVGTSITPVKADFDLESSEEITAPSLDRHSPDLVCDEETTSWPEDEGSTSSGSSADACLGCWFSTPIRPTSLVYATHPPPVPVKQKPRPKPRPKETPGKESSTDGAKKRKRLFRDGREVEDDGSFSPNFQPISAGVKKKKKYRKRTTAARIRPWDPTEARVLSPVQPYSGMGITKKVASCDNASCKDKAPPLDPDFRLSGYLKRKLSLPAADASTVRPVRITTLYRPKEQSLSPQVIEDEEEFEFEYEAEIEVVDPLDMDDEDHRYALHCDNIALPSACLDLDISVSPSSTAPCIKDVCLPPPTGTISPPTLPQLTPGDGCFVTSPELFRSPRTMWGRRGSSGSFEACGSEDSHQLLDGEESFYPYREEETGRSDADCDQAMIAEEASLGDLFEADLGDVRHLDPALQPPSSSLDSQDCILRLKEQHLDRITGYHVNETESGHPLMISNSGERSSAVACSDGVISKALASFATSALQIGRKERSAKKPGIVRLNLPKALNTPAVEDDDLNIWKFTQDALCEKDILGILPSSYTFLSNN